MAEIKFTETAVTTKPKGEKKPSDAVAAHVPMVKEMIKTNTARTVEMDFKTDDDKSAVRFLISDVQAAGRIAGVTINKTVTPLTGAKNGKVSVTFVHRAKITQNRRKPASAV